MTHFNIIILFFIFTTFMPMKSSGEELTLIETKDFDEFTVLAIARNVEKNTGNGNGIFQNTHLADLYFIHRATRKAEYIASLPIIPTGSSVNAEYIFNFSIKNIHRDDNQILILYEDFAGLFASLTEVNEGEYLPFNNLILPQEKYAGRSIEGTEITPARDGDFGLKISLSGESDEIISCQISSN